MSALVTTFVMHFGEMGSRWGFNRTVGQIYALLVLSEQALSANELAEALKISRGNTSMAIKELNTWGLIAISHKPGDRKDYYQPAGNMLDMAMQVVEERKKREVNPTLSLIRDSLLETPADNGDAYAQSKMQEIHDLLETVMAWVDEVQNLSPEQLKLLIKLGSGISKVLNLKSALSGNKDGNKDANNKA